ncbi:MAG: hypothetical protein II045_00275, partial [Oscillospiraceae bacterium]|nr:hypothetical protein [Oscillospiraceae bacterium]
GGTVIEKGDHGGLFHFLSPFRFCLFWYASYFKGSPAVAQAPQGVEICRQHNTGSNARTQRGRSAARKRQPVRPYRLPRDSMPFLKSHRARSRPGLRREADRPLLRQER